MHCGWLVVEVAPASSAGAEYPQPELKGTVTVVCDNVGPAVPAKEWDAVV